MNNIQKRVKPNPFTLVQNSVDSKEKKGAFTSSKLKDCSLRTFRMEINTSDGKIRHYGLRSDNQEDAREQAIQMVNDMAFSYGDNRIMWRLAGDRHWSFQGAVHTKKSLLQKITEYFFVLDDDEEEAQFNHGK